MKKNIFVFVFNWKKLNGLLVRLPQMYLNCLQAKMYLLRRRDKNGGKNYFKSFLQNLFHHYGPQQLKGVEWRFRRKKSPQAKNLMKSNKNEIYFTRPGVDFIKVGCMLQIIEIRLHPTPMPNFLKFFTVVNIWRRKQKISAGRKTVYEIDLWLKILFFC